VSPTLTIPAEVKARAAAEADLTLTLPGGVPMYFRRIPACPQGFLMGERGGDRDAEPVHRVVIPRDFWLGKFPVTQAQYRAVAEAWGGGKLNADPSHFKGGERPVEQVSWDDVTAWNTLLGTHWNEVDPKAADGRSFRLGHLGLPSEAQWEYACRGRSTEDAGPWSRTEYHTGDGAARLAEAGWFGEDWEKGGTHQVGQKEANGFGLCDMHGNVWEWCEDVFDAKAYRKREDGWQARAWSLEDAGADATYWGDARTPGQDPVRVVRGGSWDVRAWDCRSAFRFWGRPVNRNGDQGFRVCLFPGPAEQE